MFGCGCCGRSSEEKSTIERRSLEDEKDQRFGNSFQGKNPQEREHNAKKHCDDILKTVKREGFKVDDLKQVKPAPMFMNVSGGS